MTENKVLADLEIEIEELEEKVAPWGSCYSGWMDWPF